MQPTEEIVQDLADVNRNPEMDRKTRNAAWDFLVRLANEGSTEAQMTLREIRHASRKNPRSIATTIGDQINQKDKTCHRHDSRESTKS